MNKAIDTYDVIVIGAGVAGAFTVLELAKKYRVLVLESGDEMIPRGSSSYEESYKLHLGLHYLGHERTAIKCLLSAIKFAKTYPELILGKATDPCRHGRHYIMSNSLFGIDVAKKVAQTLRLIYKNEVKTDIKNKVFGEPRELITELEPHDYNYIAQSIPFTDKVGNTSKEHVAMGFSTNEVQLDIAKCKRFLSHQFATHQHIKFLPHSSVNSISLDRNNCDYKVGFVHSANKITVGCRTNIIVNCSWKNAETLDKQISFYTHKPKMIRIKISLLVELPKVLHTVPSSLFSIGPYCSVTNLNDGTAVLTYEPVTNAGEYVAGDHQAGQCFAKLYNTPLSVMSGKGKELANSILTGVTHYIPAMGQARILEVRVGHVMMPIVNDEATCLYSKNSAIHTRTDDGVEMKGLGYIDNLAFKMTYAVSNAIKVSKLVDYNLTLRNEMRQNILNNQLISEVMRSALCH